MKKQPVIFHVGLHKTGTTWLQDLVFKKNDNRCILYEDNRKKIRGTFVLPNYIDFSTKVALDKFSNILNEATSRSVPAVFSDESLAGLPYKNKFNREISMIRIRDTFPHAQVLVTIREQCSLIRSYYGHYIRGGGVASLTDFLTQPTGDNKKLWDPILNLDFFEYLKFLEFLQNLFGEERVTFVPMEWMLANPNDFMNMLSEKWKVEWLDDTNPDKSKVVNPAWSSIAFETARVINHLYAGKPRYKKTHPFRIANRVASIVDKYTPSDARTRGKKRQVSIIEQAIGDRYSQSNSILADKIGIDLKKHGYKASP